MERVLGKGMSWFSSELSTLALYGPAALTGQSDYSLFLRGQSLNSHSYKGALVSQLFLGRIHEQTMFTSLLLSQTFLACVTQFAGIGSGGLFFLTALPLFFSIALNALFVNGGEISLWTYALGQFSPILCGTQVLTATLDVFVPLVSIWRLFKIYVCSYGFVVHRRDALALTLQPSISSPVSLPPWGRIIYL
jgi:hypothetical protein